MYVKMEKGKKGDLSNWTLANPSGTNNKAEFQKLLIPLEFPAQPSENNWKYPEFREMHKLKGRQQ